MDIEHSLAEASFERVKMRDPKNRDHKMKVTELTSLAPNFRVRQILLLHRRAFIYGSECRTA